MIAPPLTPHHSTTELGNRYRRATRAVERSRWHILWLYSRRIPIRQIIEMTGYGRSTISALIRAYNRGGEAAVRDGRQDNGSSPALNEAQQKYLLEALSSPPLEGGFWSGAAVCRLVKKEYGIEISAVCACSYFKRLGYSPQKPRPKHLQSASIKEQDAFKKKVAELIKSIRETHPDKQVELWVQDEGRVGLKPEIRRIWAARGKRPIILQKRGYKWVYVYTFVEPLTGKTDFLILPTVSISLMELALEEFSKQIDPKGEKKILLLLDGAGWHTSARLKVPENIILQKFPPYTPELSPAEPLVKKVKESIYNQTLTKIEEVIELLNIQCQRLGKALEEIRSLCYFSWIRDIWESV